MKVGYKIRNKWDEETFQRKFGYFMGVTWDYNNEAPVYTVTNGKFSGWNNEWKCKMPIKLLYQFNDYYEEIFYNKK